MKGNEHVPAFKIRFEMMMGPYAIGWEPGSALYGPYMPDYPRNPNYWKKGLPYLEGIKYFIIKDTSARVMALRSGRVDIELRFLSPADTDAIKAQLGDKVVVAATNTLGNFGVDFNVDKKPFIRRVE